LAGKDLRGLFLAHRRELEAYLTDRLRDREIAADLVQETFLRFTEQGAAVIHDRAYLYRTAHNLAVDHVRRRHRQRTETAPHEALAHIPEERPGPEAVAVARQRLDDLRAAVLELPARTREVFVLNRVEGLTYAQVAARMAISESSVQKHLARALSHVMRRIGAG
jgi:RNA polymerase sigma-70 factor (ECF subfamily)